MSPLLIVALALALFGCLLYLLSLLLFPDAAPAASKLQPFASLPTPGGALPLLGHYLQLLKPSVHLLLTEWANQYGPLYRLRLLGKNVLVVSDAALAAPLLGSGPDALPKARLAYQGAVDAGVPGVDVLFTTPDFRSDYHRTVRKGLAVLFTMDNMRRQVFPVASARAREQVCAWARAAGWNTAATANAASSSSAPAATAPLAIEALEGLLHASLDVLLEAVFKMELSEGEKEEFLARLEEALDEVSLRATDPLRTPLQRMLPFLPQSRIVKVSFRRLRSMWEKVYDHIQASAPYAENDTSLPACMWRLQRGGLSKAQVVANMAPMVIGGFDTNAGTVAWLLYDLASNPGVQAKVVSELRAAGLLLPCPTADGVAGGAGGAADGVAGADAAGAAAAAGAQAKPLAWEHLQSLPYFNAVLKESMRLHAVASSTATVREAAERDAAVGGVRVPRGTIVWVPVNALHCAARNFEAPLAFRPERWLLPEGGGADGKAAAAAAAAAAAQIMPFSIGPAGCIGQNMANVVVRALALELARSLWFDVDPAMGSLEDVHRRQYVGLTLKCEGGIRLLARPHDL